MTQMNDVAGGSFQAMDEPRPRERTMPRNVGDVERAVSVAAGAIAALQGISRGTLPGLIVAGVGGALVYRGLTGYCPAYAALELDTANQRPEGLEQIEDEVNKRGIHVEQAYLVNRPAEDLYGFWRNFENLPRIMSHLDAVRVLDGRRSRWVVKTGRLGPTLEWDAEITEDEPNSRIAWRSLPGADVDHRGEIRFAAAPGDRGTEVHVLMDYVPPAGKLGNFLASMLGRSPRGLLKDDLRNFKRLMEIGEVLTTDGQPRGTCMGGGKRQEGD